MAEKFIRNRITELRLKKGVSENQMSMELGQNRSYIQAISSGRSMPYRMGVADFEEALKKDAGIPLKASTREKLEKKDAGFLPVNK